MNNFVQQFKVPISIIIGFLILGVMLRGDSSPQPIPQSQTSIEILESAAREPLLDTEPKDEAAEFEQDSKIEVGQLVSVTYVVDGDTIEIDTGERVRLIGIDAPERGASFYTEAKNELSKLVLNKQVRMEKDVSDVDRYSRLLRYIYADDIFVNLEMVKRGYATISTYPPDVKYSNHLLEADESARSGKIGLWSPEESTITQWDSSIVLEPGFSLPTCSNSDCNCADFASHAHAQWFYVNYDPNNTHRLDGDRDGSACESLP